MVNALVTMVQVDKCAPSAASAWTKRKPPKVRPLVPAPTSTRSSVCSQLWIWADP